MKVLMTTDGSKAATAAMLSACRILAPEDRDVDLICVVPDGKHHKHHDKLCRRAAHVLEAGRAALANEGVSARTIVKQGSPARTLIGASSNYDATVVGAASQRDRRGAGLGPVASRLVEHSNSAVLVAREIGSDSGIKILVPVDGSEASLSAVDAMVRLIDLSSADLTLLHVAETPWLHPGNDQEWLNLDAETEAEIDDAMQFRRELVDDGEAIVEAARDRLPARAAVSTLIYEGLPGDEILSEAERGGYDLIVVGAAGVTDLKHQMLGSVSSKLAWNAPCSVLLIRPGG